MSVPRRLPPTPEEREAITRARLTPGALRGRTRFAAPVVDSQRLQSMIRAAGSPSSASQVQFQHDSWSLSADGAQTEALTYLPVAGSEHVYLNGLEQAEGTDWSRSGQTLSVASAMGALSGDLLEARYAYLIGSPSTVTSGVIVPFDSAGWKYLQVSPTDSTDYSSPTFNDSTWATGTAPFGSTNKSPVVPQPNWGSWTTNWDLDTSLWVRRSISSTASGFQVQVKCDNYASAYWNGTLIGSTTLTSSQTEPAVFDVPGNLITSGTQTLAVKGSDDGPMSYEWCYLDVQVVGVA